ncbi:hypothetical protein [Sorangium sp. So ce145]|uniref:hypothetical protein n=1 Tax=Sorangium sp. So ce145 TaxID=3133285 RepID=UPI003F5D81FE
MANLVHEREDRVDEASDHSCDDTDVYLASRSRCDKDATSSHPTFTYANMPPRSTVVLPRDRIAQTRSRSPKRRTQALERLIFQA